MEIRAALCIAFYTLASLNAELCNRKLGFVYRDDVWMYLFQLHYKFPRPQSVDWLEHSQ
jgi:hypothetical protein